MKKCLIIDDHFLIRSGIRILFTDMYQLVQISEAHDSETAMNLLSQFSYDIIILDIHLQDSDGFALITFIKKKYPSAKVLIFSMSPEQLYAIRFINAGANGFINKSAPIEEIRFAIDRVLNNKKYLSDNIWAELAGGEINRKDKLFDLLSPREFEIVFLLLEGKATSHIAKNLSLGLSTICTHKKRIFTKLKVVNLIELKELSNFYI